MIKDKNIFALFPTVLATLTYDCGEDIRNYLNSVDMATDIPDKNKEDYGLVSRNTFILNDPIAKPLADVILQESKTIMTDILAYKINDTQLTQSWVSHKLPNQHHKKHIHPNSVISGVYYWNDEEHMPITFHKNYLSSTTNVIDVDVNKELSLKQPLSWDSFTVKPYQNLLILFPSYLIHEVEKNNQDCVRKSLSFNIMPTNSLGVKEKLTYFMFGNL
jgi:hypothetical protein